MTVSFASLSLPFGRFIDKSLSYMIFEFENLPLYVVAAESVLFAEIHFQSLPIVSLPCPYSLVLS